jgi:hypothetical protein
MNWLAVKREVTDAIGSVDRLRGRARHYSVRKITPPAYFVDLPEAMNLHVAGDMSRWTVPFSVVVGAVDAESSEIELSEFTDELGPRSVVRAVEDHLYVACSVVTVTSIEPVSMTIAGIQYLGALFSSDIAGKGR